jgi:hypothetical protein
MNYAFAKKLLVLAPIVIGLILAVGCRSLVTGHTSAIHLRVVDSKTGQPLPGASGVWREDLEDVAYGRYQTGPTGLLPSDNSGVISIDVVHSKMTGRLILSCPGYTTVYGSYSEGTLSTSDHIQPPPFPQEVFVLDDSQPCNHEGGYFIVPMHK